MKHAEASSAKKVTVYVPHDLWLRARMKALTEGRSLSAVITELLQAWAQRPAKGPAR